MQYKTRRIVTIIPADGWYAFYGEKGCSGEKSKIACMALFDDGEIEFMDADSDGVIDRIAGVLNLLCVKHIRDNEELL